MSYVKPISALVLSFCVGLSVRADDPKPEAKPDAKPEATADAKPEEKKEAPAAAVPATPVDPAIAAAAAAEAKEKAAREIREAAQSLVEKDVMLRAEVRKLASPGWREAQVKLIAAGKTAVPYLIEAMGELGESTPPAAYNLGGHTKFDTGRATRQRTLAEVASEVLTEMVKNHTSFKGEVPAADQREWQTWWTANGETVVFGK